jgi:lysozyme family protein
VTAFDKALRFVLQWESEGFTDISGDRGGPTKYGISLVHNHANIRDLDGDGDVDAADVKLMGYDDAKRIYTEKYWDVLRCADMPERLGLVVMDSAVNCGCKRAAQWLQGPLMVGSDGKIGPKTIGAALDYVLRHGEADLISEVLDAREKHYLWCIAKDTSQEKFRRGWFNRLDALRKEVGA